MADVETEDLEYHVTFPTAISTDSGDGGTDIPSPLDRREPVVILLGWMGCNDRYLSKYSAIYHSKGFTTVRYIIPVEHLRWPRKVKEVARKVLELVFDLGLEENVVFFHMFSNGGCYIYRYITQILHDPAFDGGELASIKVAGCVYDSCPCPASIWPMIRGANMADKTGGFFTRLIRTTFLLLATLLSLFLPATSTWNILKEANSFMADMKTDPSRYPQLFLYSKTDHVCQWRVIDDLVEARRKKRVVVQQVCWEDSKHCGHLIAHREEYIQNCQDFVEGCLLNFVD